MVVELKGIVPVLDAALPVMEELVRFGITRVKTSTHPDAIGLAFDARNFIRKFYPYFDTKIIKKSWGKEYSLFSNGKKGGRFDERWLLELEFNEDLDFISSKDEEYFNKVLLTTYTENDFSDEAYVRAVTNRSKIKNDFFEFFRIKLGIEFPKYVQKIRLDFHFGGWSPFVVNTFYQDFDLMGIYKKPSGEVIDNYPTSIFKDIRLSKNLWGAIESPIFWSEWGKCYSEVLNIMAGKITPEGVAKKCNVRLDRIEKRIKTAEENCGKLIKDCLEGTNLDDLCKKVNCPQHLQGLFLVKPLKSYKFFINLRKVEARDPETIKLIQTYNNYLIAKGEKPITIEEVLLKLSVQEEREDFYMSQNLREEHEDLGVLVEN